MKPAKLHVVKDEPVDLYAKWKAEIKARDWEACHIRGDRSRPLEFVRRIVRGWRK